MYIKKNTCCEHILDLRYVDSFQNTNLHGSEHRYAGPKVGQELLQRLCLIVCVYASSRIPSTIRAMTNNDGSLSYIRLCIRPYHSTLFINSPNSSSSGVFLALLTDSVKQLLCSI